MHALHYGTRSDRTSEELSRAFSMALLTRGSEMPVSTAPSASFVALVALVSLVSFVSFVSLVSLVSLVSDEELYGLSKRISNTWRPAKLYRRGLQRKRVDEG